jgi:cystathionine gamma-synthase
MISFNIGGSIEQTAAFLKTVEQFTLAESLGGVESLICHPATMTHAGMEEAARIKAGIDDSLIRISVGIESVADLIADLDAAFQHTFMNNELKEKKAISNRPAIW